MKAKWVHAYMDIAKRTGELSMSIRLKVGTIIVKDNRIISMGYNGTPAGWDNNCEDKIYMPTDSGGWLDSFEIDEMYPYTDTQGHYKLVTKPGVIHSEENAVVKLARDGESGKGATLFCTHACCLACAKLIAGSGIEKVVYGEEYRDGIGIDFLKRSNLKVINYGLFKNKSEKDQNIALL